jgi:hypothetical protein|tara:strand:+ start:167 stop:610 length:444 start_codon:yes stop_codon:yes gene_type:complete
MTMTNIIMGGIVALCLFAFNVSQTKAQETNPGKNCRSMEKAVEFLEKNHGEFIAFRGLSIRGHVTTVYINETTGTWTALVLYPSLEHKMCVVDSGTIGEKVDGKTANKINTDPAQDGFRRFFNVNTAYEYLLRIFGVKNPEIVEKPL